MNSLEKICEKLIEDIVRDRITQWSSYYFEKELLPCLINEITSKIRTEIYTNANIPEEIKLRIRFDKSEINK